MNLEAAHNFQLPALEVYDHFLNGLWLRILIQALQEAFVRPSSFRARTPKCAIVGAACATGGSLFALASV